MASSLRNILEALVPVAKTSTFKETGRLTPDEFVLAGDFLVHKFPTWTWATGDKSVSYLPAEKQHLVTFNVPVIRETLWSSSEWVFPVTGEDGECIVDQDSDDDEFEKLTFDRDTPSKEDAPDIDDDSPTDELQSDGQAKTLAVRSYNLSITYDKYSQTPRMWLSGFDESGISLDPKVMYEDVSSTHLGKTITLEQHPHEEGLWLTIHPCRHASVMKKIYASKPECLLDHYMVLFLKFMSSVLYHIDYDNSMDF